MSSFIYLDVVLCTLSLTQPVLPIVVHMPCFQFPSPSDLTLLLIHSIYVYPLNPGCPLPQYPTVLLLWPWYRDKLDSLSPHLKTKFLLIQLKWDQQGGGITHQPSSSTTKLALCQDQFLSQLPSLWGLCPALPLTPWVSLDKSFPPSLSPASSSGKRDVWR